MKKFLAVLLSLVLVSTMSVVFVMAEDVSAEVSEEPLEDGFVFNIDGVDTSIAGEDGVIATSAEAVANANFKWSINFLCEKVADNVYKVKADGAPGNGSAPSFTLAADDIVIGIHSSTSDPAQVETYPNQPQKVAATKVKAGMYITLAGIDLAAKTATNGTATVSLTDPSGSESEVSEVPDYTDITGELVTNPSYLLEVTAPATYVPGETVNVTITLKSVVPAGGISLINFLLYYDAAKVEPVVLNDAATENDAMNDFLVTAPTKDAWEGLNKLEEAESRYDISFLTTNSTVNAKDDGSMVIVIPFKVKATATGSIAFQAPHADTNAYGAGTDYTDYFGNAGLAVAELATANESSDDTSEPTTGDAGIIAIAVVAVLALAGVMTVAVKKRSR